MNSEEPKKPQESLREAVEACLNHYLAQLDGDEPSDLYRLVIGEAEYALFKTVLEHTNNNQSKAADCLGITRGTLRKKIRLHQLNTKSNG